MNNYEIETDEYLKFGLNLFQYSLFGDTEEEHVQKFCNFIQPHGVVVDMGAGVGSMGKLMKAVCPSIDKVINVTNSPTQAKRIVDKQEICILSDFHSVPEIAGGSADIVMFNESFGYGDPDLLMIESSRILKSGGLLVIKDFSVNKRLLDVIDLTGWGYKIFPQHQILLAAAKSRLRCLSIMHPEISTKRWGKFMEESTMPKWHGEVDYDGTTAIFVFSRTQGNLT